MWQLIDTASKAADTGDIRDGVVRVSDGHRAARYSEAAGHDGRRWEWGRVCGGGDGDEGVRPKWPRKEGMINLLIKTAYEVPPFSTPTAPN